MIGHARLRHRIARQPGDIDVRPLLDRMHNEMCLRDADRPAAHIAPGRRTCIVPARPAFRGTCRARFPAKRRTGGTRIADSRCPTPMTARPLLITSSMPISSSMRSGWYSGATITAVPSRMLRRLRRQRDRHRHRRRAQAVVGEMMLGEPGDVEADRLRHFHLLHHLLIQLPRRHRAVALRHQAEQTEMHDARRPSDADDRIAAVQAEHLPGDEARQSPDTACLARSPPAPPSGCSGSSSSARAPHRCRPSRSPSGWSRRPARSHSR